MKTMPLPNKTISTQRLILRDFTPDDFDAVHAYASLPDVSKFEPWGPNTKEDTRAYIERAIASTQQRPRMKYEMAITLKATSQLIGAIRIGQEDANSMHFSLGYIIHPDHQGKGFATEATQKIIEFGLKTLKAELIYSTCDVLNIASKRVMEKAGMTLVKRIDNHIEIKGRMRASYRFEIN